MKLKYILLTAAAASLAAGVVYAGTVVTGRCPGVITFHGEVTVRGDYQNGVPAEIGYQFTRSDGATGQNKYIETHGPGVYPITETWTLGGAQLPHFEGWEKFKAWPTDSAQNHAGTVWSNEAHFTLQCR
jgi:hypothetical protein